MRAVVHLVEVVPRGLVEPLDTHSGVDHRLDLLGIELGAAQPVEKDVDLDARPGALGERVGELATDRRPTNRCSSRK
jgi:hypothetical protein